MTRLDSARVNGSAGRMPVAPSMTMRPRGIDAVSVLTVYLVLLYALPSGLGVTSLGSLGRPATLWALGATIWWLGSQVQRHVPIQAPRQPVRIAMFCFLGVALISFAWAMTRGIPATETTSANSGIVTIASWCGILLVANDGIADIGRFRVLARRITLGAALLALLGLLQFVTNSSLIGWISLPGMSIGSTKVGGLDARAGFLRATGTSTSALEYGVVLCVALPIAIMLALRDTDRSILRRWTQVALIGAAIAMSISRSSLIGAVVALLVLLPALTRRARVILIGGGVVMLVGVGVLVPGMFGTIRGLFGGLSGNPSITSRTNGLNMAVEFISHSPVLGKGFGTFWNTYYIYDDEYLLLATEVGIVGLAAFVTLLVVAMRAATRSRRLLSTPLDRQLAQSLVAAVIVTAVLFAFFDGLSFPQAAGTLMLILGLCGALRRLALSSQWEHDSAS